MNYVTDSDKFLNLYISLTVTLKTFILDYQSFSESASTFNSAYLPDENMAVDESLNLWSGCLGFRQ
jgi:hypothetical protein